MKKSIRIAASLSLAMALGVFALTGCGGSGNGSETAEGVMSHEEYMAAANDSEVVIDTYVQAKQSWWEDKATIYAQSKDGAYFIYNMACSEEDYAKLTPGTKIRVTGYKTEWSGEIEVAEGATFEILSDDTYVASPVDVMAPARTATTCTLTFP